MDSQGGRYLNQKAVCSPLGAARLCQLVLGCAVVAMVIHSAGYSGSYGVFCMVVWCLCFAVTTLIFFLDATRLYGCLSVSWGNLTVAFAALATLMYVTASVVYPLYFVSSECPYAGCHVRNFRIAVAACSVAATLSYGAEVVLSRARPGQTAVGYMATVSGVLKVVQAFVACVIFGAVANGSEFTRHPRDHLLRGGVRPLLRTDLPGGPGDGVRPDGGGGALHAVRPLRGGLHPAGRPALPERVGGVDGVLLRRQIRVSVATVVCPWDSKVVVAVFSFVNLALYAADLVYSQRMHFVSSRVPARPRV
ncbi:Myeloid-associated differentiation marker-like protein 2 [Merluccius polli]|uniref:Myeloid-associated differentiation marker-like protein 2 n=1 Tax=Merluccius polli TaxID=89951 RepID=A0AA47N1J9_MERPO|nr:Myeloid-associated differentiation marker-like protein 2 [Merluccius polli]